jgi:predicted kinase
MEATARLPGPEAVIFIGAQGAGKSTFYRERFFDTHLRLNLDMLRTRHRLQRLLAVCLETGQPFVLDNTNATAAVRAPFIAAARQAHFRVTGYWFDLPLGDCLRRNAQREGRQRIPASGVIGTYKRLERPALAEGFNALYRVRLDAERRFVVEPFAEELSVPDAG